LISIPLIKIWGAVGSAIGTCLSLVFGNIIFMNWYYHKRIGINIIYFWKEISKFIPALIAPVTVGICIMRFSNVEGILKIIVFAGIYTVVYCASMYFLGFNKYEKSLITGVVKKAINKLKKNAQ
ncbi:MAG: polysaccharide biosynthesis C-terminal domain-containing protein, partial [Clostridia bacterium]|nr:polysaccharide biosynthesis C-terminal domain-containing protein [Clostridia bacterium]